MGQQLHACHHAAVWLGAVVIPCRCIQANAHHCTAASACCQGYVVMAGWRVWSLLSPMICPPTKCMLQRGCRCCWCWQIRWHGLLRVGAVPATTQRAAAVAAAAAPQPPWHLQRHLGGPEVVLIRLVHLQRAPGPRFRHGCMVVTHQAVVCKCAQRSLWLQTAARAWYALMCASVTCMQRGYASGAGSEAQITFSYCTFTSSMNSVTAVGPSSFCTMTAAAADTDTCRAGLILAQPLLAMRREPQAARIISRYACAS
jgi:hypothetical protein